MKDLKIFALAAFALLGFAACQQEELAPEIQTPTHTVTFVADAPETKTTANIDGETNTVNYAWTSEDVDRFTVYENGTKAKKAEGVLASGKMTVKATFEGPAPETVSYVAVVNESNATQIMSSEAYDEEADILVSRAVSSFDGENGVQLQFKREVAIAKMTLKGLDANEVVNMVTVSSTADLAGSYDVKGWASPAETSLEISSASGYSIEANESGEAVVWFTCIPQDAATLTVKVEAEDGDTYTKQFSKPITLNRGDVTSFGVAMVKDAKSSYILYEGETLIEGDYIIVSGTTAMVASDTDNDTRLDYTTVEITKGTISSSLQQLEWHIAPSTTEGYWTIFNSKANAYASSTGAKSKAQLLSSGTDDKALWICAKTPKEPTYDFTNKHNTANNVNSTLRYNSGYGFACYATGTGKPLQLYRKDARTPLEAPKSLSVSDMTVSWSPVEGAVGYRVVVGTTTNVVTDDASYTFTGEADYYDVSVTALADENSETNKDSNAATLTAAKFGTPTLATPTLKEGSVDESSVNTTWTVDPRATAGYNCELYKGDTKVDSKTVHTGSVTFNGLNDGVTYTVKVNAKAVEGTKAYAASDVATINLTTKGTVTLSQITKEGTYTVKDVTVYAVINKSIAVIGDGTAYFYMYKSNHGLDVGNTFTIGGEVVEYSTYGGILEFNSPNITNKDTGSEPVYKNPVEANEEYLTSYASAPVAQYIHAKGTQSGRNITIGLKKLYLSADNTATNGKDVEVYGFVYGYNSNSSYAYFYATSIAEDPTVPKLSVTPTSKTWESNEIDAAVFKVTTNAEGKNGWSVTHDPVLLNWANIVVNEANGTITVTPKGANNAETANEATLTVTHDADSNLSETITLTQRGTGKVPKTATITFGTKNVNINDDSVSANDNCNNSWTITTVGTTSFTPQPTYCQVGSSSKPATSITFTTTLPSDAEEVSIKAKFGGFSGTAGSVSLKVGDASVGSGALNASNDVTVSSTSTAAGNVVTVSITNISKGVKCYYIQVGYKTAK